MNTGRVISNDSNNSKNSFCNEYVKLDQNSPIFGINKIAGRCLGSSLKICNKIR